jgi:hypothetical protein
MGQLVSALVLIAVCTVIGTRLVLLSRRTRALPELLIGSAFLLAGIVGMGFELVRVIVPASDATRVALGNVASVGMHAGVSCIAAFTWRVFRPADAAGRLVVGALAVGLLASLASEIAMQQPLRVTSGMHVTFGLSVRASVYLWAAFECGRYWLRLRRQVRLGIGDPLVAARMLCWVIGSFSIAVGWLRMILLALIAPEHAEVVGSHFTTLAVLVCAGAYWLAFFPPGWFRRRMAAAEPQAIG